MQIFSDPNPFKFIGPSQSTPVIQNIIDPSLNTRDRMDAFKAWIKDSKKAEKLFNHFRKKIEVEAGQTCPEKKVVTLANTLANQTNQISLDLDHTNHYFQQLIPSIEFKIEKTSASIDKITVMVNENAYDLPTRMDTTLYSEEKQKVDNNDVRMISRTDRDADLFILKYLADYVTDEGKKLKTPDQMKRIYLLWDIYSPAIGELINYPKRKFNLKRPGDPRYLDNPASESYPGGHATAIAALVTLLLVTSGLSDEPLQTMCKRLSKAAAYMADLRAMAGIHFVEDGTAGLQLGFNVMHALLDATINPAPTPTPLALLLQAACKG